MSKFKHNYLNNAKVSYHFPWGDLYFYDNFVISQIGEGVILGKPELIEAMVLMKDYFGTEKPYGLISDRVNSYSINLPELIPIARQFGKLTVNAVVVYSNIGYGNFEIEKRLLKFKGQIFFDLNQAIDWTKKEIQNI